MYQDTNRVIIDTLAQEISHEQASNEQVRRREADDVRHAILAAMNRSGIKSKDNDRPSILKHIKAMCERGEITARHIGNGMPPHEAAAVEVHPDKYWLSAEDVQKVMALLLPIADTGSSVQPDMAPIVFNHGGGVAGSSSQDDIVPNGGTVTYESTGTVYRSPPADVPVSPPRGMPEQSAGGAVRSHAAQTHRIKTRRRPLNTEIDIAQTKAANPDDSQSIWDALCAMADKQETDKLLGVDEDGVKYRDDSGNPAWLSKRAFMARIRRRRDV
jgi:hypothetical protein